LKKDWMMTDSEPPFTSQSGVKRPPRIEYLRVQNYRALQDVEFKSITPLMVLLGPNGSGKSTVFDVFNFLSECFQYGLRQDELKVSGAFSAERVEPQMNPGAPGLAFSASRGQHASTTKLPPIADPSITWRGLPLIRLRRIGPKRSRRAGTGVWGRAPMELYGPAPVHGRRGRGGDSHLPVGEKAELGRLEARREFRYETEWNGKYYASKQVRPVFGQT
jgi:hypothetical protein